MIGPRIPTAICSTQIRNPFVSSVSLSLPEIVRTELEEARSDFLALLVSLSETDLQQKSVTSAWTVKEVLVHIVF